MTVWSLTPLGWELDILEIRLGALADVVDVHVIAESTLTYSGDPKPLYYAENAERFAPWADQIRYVPVYDSPGGQGDAANPHLLTGCDSPRWRRENHQRDALARAIDDMADDDLVILSDVDEIPRPEVVEQARGLLFHPQGPQIVRPALALNMYYANWRWVMPCVVICRFMTGRALRALGPEAARQQPGQAFGSFEPGGGEGWHFSYTGGVDAIRYKLRSAAHHEVDVPPYNTREWINECLSTGADLFGRWRPLMSVPDDALPSYLVQHRDRFKYLFGPELEPLDREQVVAISQAWRW